jgi:hypothetical protein
VCRYGVPLFGLLALTGVVTLHASDAARLPVAQPLVTVQNIRLAPAPPLNARPSSTLTFAVQNASADTFTYLALRISIVSARAGDDAAKRPIAGPYIIRGAVELRPRHILRYEMRLRNLGADCQCTVRIRVLAARTMDEKLRHRAGGFASPDCRFSENEIVRLKLGFHRQPGTASDSPAANEESHDACR